MELAGDYYFGQERVSDGLLIYIVAFLMNAIDEAKYKFCGLLP